MFRSKIVLIVVIVLLVIGSVLTYFMLSQDKKYNENLEQKLIEMGTDFYTNFYYNQMKDNVDYFHETGIPVSLISLETYGLDITDFVNRETGEPCDKEKTLAKIKFKENTKNYKDDFYIEPILVCE